MPEILEIDDDEAQRMQEEAEKQKARDMEEHKKGEQKRVVVGHLGRRSRKSDNKCEV